MTTVVSEAEINRAAADPYMATRNLLDRPVACNEAAADGYGVVDRGSGQYREVGVSIMERGRADLYRSDAPGVFGVAMGEDLEVVGDVEEDTRLDGVVLSDGARVSHVAVGNWMNEFELGDMVWGKVKSHPWWPGLIFSEEFASPSVRRTKREGHVLVAFFGDSSYGWFDPAELIPFEPNYDEKSKQTTLRPFVKAVEEAADETSRRETLALTCYCRNKLNIRAARVPGYLHVDVTGFEPGGIYSEKQIDSARDKFVPQKTLSFLQQAAKNPVSDAIAGVDGIKSIAMLLTYRRAIFEEFDETYAQAFGVEPVRSSQLAGSRPEQTGRFTSRAPLSGPLVLPEPLRHRKSANSKPPAAKVGRPASIKKNKYVLKRRDEQEITNGSVGPPWPLLPDFPSATQPNRNYFNLFPPQQQPPTLIFQDASLPGASNLGDYVLQKRPPAAATDEKPPPLALALAPQEFRDRPLQEQKPGPMAVDIPIASPRPAPAMTVIEPGKLVPVVVRQTADAKDVALLAPRAYGSKPHGVAMVDGGVPKQKKSKIRPREDGSSVASDGTGEAKRKKKKRKKEQSSGVGQLPDHLKMSKIEDLNKKPAEMPISIGSELPKGDGVARIAESFIDISQLTEEDVSFRNPQLNEVVDDLKELALDPFYGLDRDAPLVALNVFLKFRSLVYQKSLALPLASEAEALEVQTGKSSAAKPALEDVAGGSQTAPPKATKEDREPPKLAKVSFRPDDPIVAGRKHILSDRHEMSVKKLKKLEKLKALSVDKKATISQKGVEALPRDQKEGGGTMTPAAVVPSAPAKPSNKVVESIKKQEPPPPRSPSPTTLVMKFPPNTTLPSVASLKARFARFGPLELSGIRVYWQSNTCKVVYKFKSDAEAALNYGRSSKIFGEVKVQYHLRDAESAADPFADAGMQQPGSRPTEVVQFRPGSGGSGSGISFGQSKPLFNPDQKPTGQLKSILKKSGDDAGPSTGAGGRDAPRVKFMLDGVKGIGSTPPLATVAGSNSNAPTSSPLPPLDPIVSKPPKSVSFLPPPQPLSLSRPIHSYPSRVIENPYHPPPLSSAMPPLSALLRVTDKAVQSPSPLIRNIDNTESRGPVPSRFGDDQPHSHRQQSEAEGRDKANKEFASQMLSLLVRCSDIVTNVKSSVGYVPFHPL